VRQRRPRTAGCPAPTPVNRSGAAGHPGRRPAWIVTQAEDVVVNQRHVIPGRPGRIRLSGEVLVDPAQVEHVCRDQKDHSAIITDPALHRRMDFPYQPYPGALSAAIRLVHLILGTRPPVLPLRQDSVLSSGTAGSGPTARPHHEGGDGRGSAGWLAALRGGRAAGVAVAVAGRGAALAATDRNAAVPGDIVDRQVLSLGCRSWCWGRGARRCGVRTDRGWSTAVRGRWRR
jgi:hypothetical protein